jgi:hypothetical protein
VVSVTNLYGHSSSVVLSRLSGPHSRPLLFFSCSARESNPGCVCRILEEKWECSETVHQLFIYFKKAYDSVRRQVLYSILIEFKVLVKVVRLIKMCLNEKYSSPYT